MLVVNEVAVHLGLELLRVEDLVQLQVVGVAEAADVGEQVGPHVRRRRIGSHLLLVDGHCRGAAVLFTVCGAVLGRPT